MEPSEAQDEAFIEEFVANRFFRECGATAELPLTWLPYRGQVHDPAKRVAAGVGRYPAGARRPRTAGRRTAGHGRYSTSDCVLAVRSYKGAAAMSQLAVLVSVRRIERDPG